MLFFNFLVFGGGGGGGSGGGGGGGSGGGGGPFGYPLHLILCSTQELAKVCELSHSLHVTPSVGIRMLSDRATRRPVHVD